jgi:basic membrane lipoprotein Med (substrate-binding protein (PBP1-ABC) superfamily)
MRATVSDTGKSDRIAARRLASPPPTTFEAGAATPPAPRLGGGARANARHQAAAGLRSWSRLAGCAALACVAALLISGCQPAVEGLPGAVKAPGPTPAPFRVALVTTGPRTDGGWNAGAFKGLDEVKTELGLTDADVASVDNQKSAGEQEESLRAFAQQKFNMVIGHGHEYDEIAHKIEGDFPTTLFVISSGEKVGKSTTPIVLKLEDGAYLEGMLAAGMSKTGKLAEVGAEAIPPVKSVFAAFEKGARAVKPSITILPAVYTNNWDDPNAAKQATIPLLDQGADVIMQDVDAAAQGVFNAVQEANKRGKTVYALGTNNDQNGAAPDVILASAPIYIGKAFVAIAKGARDGKFVPSDAPWDMKSGTIGFVLNPQLSARVPADLKTKIDAARAKIVAGTLAVK